VKSGMQMMVESMLPPGFMDKLQTEFIPFISTLDERLKTMQATISALQNQLNVMAGMVESLTAKVDRNYVEQSTETQQYMMGVHDA
jgi:hypothetical protein